jgi:hypothetical protein
MWKQREWYGIMNKWLPMSDEDGQKRIMILGRKRCWLRGKINVGDCDNVKDI